MGAADLAESTRRPEKDEADVKRIMIVTGALLIAVLAAPIRVICPNGPWSTAPSIAV
ncbi:Uncharacterised protein [Mycolicibacterium phlei]|nr:Uncharacterised protein [Mycolicibacterium phlei]